MYARAVQRTVRKNDYEPSPSYCQCQVFLYMNFLRHNERERGQNILSVLRFRYIHFVRHYEREREKGPNILSVLSVFFCT